VTTEPHIPALVETLREVASATDRLPDAAGDDRAPRTAGAHTHPARSPPASVERCAAAPGRGGRAEQRGKSTLFNTLVAADLSPARAEGGLTQQCLAAATPETASGPGREALSARYEVVLLPPGTRAPVTEPGPPGRLFLTSTPTLPPGLVLVDTPDFDSVVRENRVRSEALLVTVDVVVFVVSRHTYQNAALVDVVQQAVGRGRPWVVVYNEAPELQTVRAHLDKLTADVGAAPFARYRSPTTPRWKWADGASRSSQWTAALGWRSCWRIPSGERRSAPAPGPPRSATPQPSSGSWNFKSSLWRASPSGCGRGSAMVWPRWAHGRRCVPVPADVLLEAFATSWTRGAR
jgi:hypothetical protein